MEMADIVLGLGRIGVGFYLETVQCEAERQGFLGDFVVFLYEKMAVGPVRLQFHPAMLPCEHGEQGSEQDAGHGEEQSQGHGAFPVLVSEGQNGGEDGKNRPKRDEPPRAIDMDSGEVGAVEFLNDGACCEDGDEQNHQDGGDMA